MNMGMSSRFEDGYDFAAFLCMASIFLAFEGENKTLADLLGIYQWAIGNKVSVISNSNAGFRRISINP